MDRDIIDIIRTQQSSRDFWAANQPTITITGASTTVTPTNTVVVPAGVHGIPVDAVIDCVHLLVKWRQTEDTSAVDNAINNVATATTITAAETIIGTEIEVGTYSTVTIWIDYTKGDETSYDIIPKFLDSLGSSDNYQMGYWSTGAVQSFTATKFQMAATGKYYLTLDITGIQSMKIYGDATGGTPTGSAQISVTLSS